MRLRAVNPIGASTRLEDEELSWQEDGRQLMRADWWVRPGLIDCCRASRSPPRGRTPKAKKAKSPTTPKRVHMLDGDDGVALVFAAPAPAAVVEDLGMIWAMGVKMVDDVMREAVRSVASLMAKVGGDEVARHKLQQGEGEGDGDDEEEGEGEEDEGGEGQQQGGQAPRHKRRKSKAGKRRASKQRGSMDASQSLMGQTGSGEERRRSSAASTTLSHTATTSSSSTQSRYSISSRLSMTSTRRKSGAEDEGERTRRRRSTETDQGRESQRRVSDSTLRRGSNNNTLRRQSETQRRQSEATQLLSSQNGRGSLAGDEGLVATLAVTAHAPPDLVLSQPQQQPQQPPRQQQQDNTGRAAAPPSPTENEHPLFSTEEETSRASRGPLKPKKSMRKKK